MEYQGYQLHRNVGSQSHFYRVIQAGTMVVTRFGHAGSQGRRLVRHLDYENDAHNYVVVARADRHRAGYVLDESQATNTQPRLLTADAVEEYFHTMWRTKSPIRLPGPGTSWALLHDVVALSRVSPMASFILEDIEDGPFVIDKLRDIVVAPIEWGNYEWIDTDEICASTRDEGVETLRALLTIMPPHIPRGGGEKLLDAARTLAATSEK